MEIESIWIDPAGFVCFRFATADARAEFLENYVPPGNVFSSAAYNMNGPPWRLTFNLGNMMTGAFELKRLDESSEICVK